MKSAFITFWIGVVVGALIVSFLWANNKMDYAILDSSFRQRLIANGCAQYNPTNGVFQYKGHK